MSDQNTEERRFITRIKCALLKCTHHLAALGAGGKKLPGNGIARACAEDGQSAPDESAARVQFAGSAALKEANRALARAGSRYGAMLALKSQYEADELLPIFASLLEEKLEELQKAAAAYFKIGCAMLKEQDAAAGRPARGDDEAPGGKTTPNRRKDNSA